MSAFVIIFFFFKGEEGRSDMPHISPSEDKTFLKK